MTDERNAGPTTDEEENGLVLDDDESQELKEVFSTVFPQYLVPLEELVDQLLDGKSSPEIIKGLEGAVAPLASAAASVGVTQLTNLLEELQQVVDRAGSPDELDETTRNEVVDVFYRLKEAVQSVSRGEPVQQGDRGDFVARLSAIEGVGGAALQKILAAGITSQEQVAGATVDEIAAVTGLPSKLAQRIHEAFGGRRSQKGGPASGGSGGMGPGSSTGQPGSVRRGPGSGQSASPDLATQIALAGVVRERIRLVRKLDHALRVVRDAAAQVDASTRAVVLLETRLAERRAHLEREQESARACENAVRRLIEELEQIERAELEAVPGGSVEAVSKLHGELRRMKWRFVTRTS